MTTIRLVRVARYLNLRTHSPGHPVLNTQLGTPSPHRIRLELRSHRPRPITLVSLQGRLQNQLGVALDALTISSFLVIDDKLVEVFNGEYNM